MLELEVPTIKLWSRAMAQADVPEVERNRESYRRHLREIFVLDVLSALVDEREAA